MRDQSVKKESVLGKWYYVPPFVIVRSLSRHLGFHTFLDFSYYLFPFTYIREREKVKFL